MKRLIPCCILLPLLTSCEMTQPEYYEAGYYHSAQPHSEIYGFDERPHDYRHPNPHHRTHKKTKGATNQAKTHGHNHHANDQKQVTVNNAKPNNVHGHDKKKNQVS
ncbi:hypothetical protein LEAN103870_13515 [Legionella anisa]|uniref:Lipoprotein n=1 Tax=Legionella anisa TaxID=28082 RepID=A0AAX0WVE1_9GAMM|nr:hypothetical protein [Legionella anisa]AWN73693.1 hypothetical protein DLD14_07485 [Legionella anisa]KTC70301.1 hypothetical protein Lani_1848 [Legionella anisa]MBN5936343.1 hypothetical protein [Legionella anisa]MCW8426586.1 hypothetical protein [Legionella anisa]MCW8448249.1 hypothetical protein [Legionella anisa]